MDYTVARKAPAYIVTSIGLTAVSLFLSLHRQHLQHEMAHYAEDCWDAEVQTSYGWVECAGLADRSAYDLRAHTSVSKVGMRTQHSLRDTHLFV